MTDKVLHFAYSNEFTLIKLYCLTLATFNFFSLFVWHYFRHVINCCVVVVGYIVANLLTFLSFILFRSSLKKCVC